MNTPLNEELVSFALSTESFSNQDEILAEVLIKKKYLMDIRALATAFTRLLQEVQLKQNFPYDKRIKVSSKIIYHPNNLN